MLVEKPKGFKAFLNLRLVYEFSISIKQLETDINDFINTNIDFSRDYRFNDNIIENATVKDKHFREYYTSQWMIDKVAERYEDDISHFNYEFGN